MKRTLSIVLLASAAILSYAAEPSDTTITELQEYVVTSNDNTLTLRGTALNSQLITAGELKRAACCNLGESFTTNPSVDVSYSDAATGARQIKLLGLAGTYVQMLTENIPNFRGAAAPYGLGYIAGPWMQSIQVSKGASSVKNGYESITGQINIEMKKPQLYPSIAVNAYADIMGKAELNFDGNIHLDDKWSTGLLVHGENAFATHDENDDSFADMPRIRQVTAMNRWAYLGQNYVFQAAVKFLGENRRGGQTGHHIHGIENPYIIEIGTTRVEAFTKNAYIFDRENDGNVALIASFAFHDQNSEYGLKRYDIAQNETYLSLMFERKWNSIHSLSTGLSFNHDAHNQHYRLYNDAEMPLSKLDTRETVGGVYGQYTLTLENKLIAMAGARYDYNSLYGSLFTPRVHLRAFAGNVNFQASAGRGFHSPHLLAEYSYLLASSRRLDFSNSPQMEKAWNYGAGVHWDFSAVNRKFSLGAEYYYTDFSRQLTVDLDTDPHAAIFCYDGKSRSHTFQVEASADILPDLNITAAYRLTDVTVNYGYGFIRKPLTSRHKGLFTAGYSPMMGLWQFDATLSINGGGNMPKPYILADGSPSWQKNYNAFMTLNAQITRNFRHWSVYIGGENLTGYKQKDPIIGSSNPWGNDFDSTMIYAPLHGAVIYVGFRYNITKYI